MIVLRWGRGYSSVCAKVKVSEKVFVCVRVFVCAEAKRKCESMHMNYDFNTIHTCACPHVGTFRHTHTHSHNHKLGFVLHFLAVTHIFFPCQHTFAQTQASFVCDMVCYSKLAVCCKFLLQNNIIAIVLSCLIFFLNFFSFFASCLGHILLFHSF